MARPGARGATGRVMATCSYCGGEKRREPVLCGWCLSQLPPPSRALLDERVDQVVAKQRAIQLLNALRRGVPLSRVKVVA